MPTGACELPHMLAPLIMQGSSLQLHGATSGPASCCESLGWYCAPVKTGRWGSAQCRCQRSARMFCGGCSASAAAASAGCRAWRTLGLRSGTRRARERALHECLLVDSALQRPWHAVFGCRSRVSRQLGLPTLGSLADSVLALRCYTPGGLFVGAGGLGTQLGLSWLCHTSCGLINTSAR